MVCMQKHIKLFLYVGDGLFIMTSVRIVGAELALQFCCNWR